MFRGEKLFRAGRAFGVCGNDRGAQARNRGRGFDGFRGRGRKEVDAAIARERGRRVSRLLISLRD